MVEINLHRGMGRNGVKVEVENYPTESNKFCLIRLEIGGAVVKMFFDDVIEIVQLALSIHMAARSICSDQIGNDKSAYEQAADDSSVDLGRPVVTE